LVDFCRFYNKNTDHNIIFVTKEKQETLYFMATGKLLIFSAPSGAGKSTIINHLLTKGFNLAFSISATSRKPRGEEQSGKEYYFLSPEEFKEKIKNNEFLEYEEVYTDCFYGTLKSEVERITKAGQNVVFDVDVIGGLYIKKYYGGRALSVFIAPPSIEELRNRLTKRNTDSQDMINERINKAQYELSFAPQYDVVVVNDDLSKALFTAEEVTREFLSV
jgi:guanylate kinase